MFSPSDTGVSSQQLRHLFSDLRLFSQPAELLAMLCRLDKAALEDSPDRVAIGDQLLLAHEGSGELLSFKLVMPGDAAPRCGRVSVFSPVGRAVYQRRAGDDCVMTVKRQRLVLSLLHIYR